MWARTAVRAAPRILPACSVLGYETVISPVFMRLIKVAALVACLGVASSACFWRERDVHDDRHDHDDHHDEHRDDRR
jgi:hypothetical protein